MSDIINPEKNIFLEVLNDHDHKMICKIGHALSAPDRLRILKSVLRQSKNLSELSAELNIPVSSVSRHVDALADAQLVFVSYQPGLKGHTKYCSQIVLSCTFSLETPRTEVPDKKAVTVEMPVGLFSDCKIMSPCGMTGKDGSFCEFDNPAVFFLPDRTKAECIWFDRGFLTYNFPSPLSLERVSELTFSFEICSETVYYNNVWPSDITITVNGIELATFTSPGDFGGRRGRYTPEYWPLTSTQFGILKKVTINSRGVFIDNAAINAHVTIDDLNILDRPSVKLSIGIKDDAVHRGGINLFGKNFGDYPQAIVMSAK